jgi:transcriptional regulator with XRE-family HTH domain
VLGVTRQTLNNVIHGKSGISPQMAIRLSKAFGSTPETWLALAARVQGMVIVKVKLDDKGNVTDAVAIQTHPLFTPACLSHAKKWKFRPNAHNAALIVYRFRLTEDTCTGGWYSRYFPPNFVVISACSVVINGEMADHPR